MCYLIHMMTIDMKIEQITQRMAQDPKVASYFQYDVNALRDFVKDMEMEEEKEVN